MEFPFFKIELSFLTVLVIFDIKPDFGENFNLDDMKEKNSKLLLSNLTSHIIQAAYNVYNCLGYGFLESVYEKSFQKELKLLGINSERQVPVQVFYKTEMVGDFRADLVVEGAVIVELKAVEKIHPIHEVQLVNYLRGTELEVGLLFNFGPELSFKRKIFTNDRKNANNKTSSR